MINFINKLIKRHITQYAAPNRDSTSVLKNVQFTKNNNLRTIIFDISSKTDHLNGIWDLNKCLFITVASGPFDSKKNTMEMHKSIPQYREKCLSFVSTLTQSSALAPASGSVLKQLATLTYTTTIPCAFIDSACTVAWSFDQNSTVSFKMTFTTPSIGTWYSIGFNTVKAMVSKSI